MLICWLVRDWGFLCAVHVSSRCTDTGGTESECTESSGRGGEGTAALEGNCGGPHPAAPRLCLPGVALLPEPGALLPYVSNERSQLEHLHQYGKQSCAAETITCWLVINVDFPRL